MIAELAPLLDAPPFGLRSEDKRPVFERALAALTRHHHANCPEYRKILTALDFESDHGEIPFLPARLFKSHDLRSAAAEDVFKVMVSSGTGGRPSRIVLDRETASLQAKVLTRIVGDFIGPARLPMLVIDKASIVKNQSGSARAAAILGFSIFGRDVAYALAEDMSLDWAAIDRFHQRHASGPVLVFGFTFMVFEHLFNALGRAGRRLDLADAILIHGGGWKKLADRAVDNGAFKRMAVESAGIRRVHNYYGLIEQTGSIFMECEHGRLHCSNFSDIITRSAELAPLPMGHSGIVQLTSLLPHSYPGHVLLTEDEGTIDGEDDCPCGRFGKTFRIHGRLAQAEIRGCSDTHATA